jgi:hypothetical protein
MNDLGSTGELPGLAIWDLLFAVLVLGLIAVLCVRRWTGVVVPDRTGWQPHEIVADQRFRLGLGLLLAAAWMGVAAALVRQAMEPAVVSGLATHVGPVPLPPWLALVLQDGHQAGLTFALWSTGLWLDRSISKQWSKPRPTAWPGGQSALAVFLALVALLMSVSA